MNNNMYQPSMVAPTRDAQSSNYYTQSTYPANINYGNANNNDERLVGGFAFPFLLGGVTGAALAPAFWRPNNGYRPPVYYPPYPPYPVPYRRWF